MEQSKGGASKIPRKECFRKMRMSVSLAALSLVR